MGWLDDMANQDTATAVAEPPPQSAAGDGGGWLDEMAQEEAARDATDSVSPQSVAVALDAKARIADIERRSGSTMSDAGKAIMIDQARQRMLGLPEKQPDVSAPPLSTPLGDIANAGREIAHRFNANVSAIGQQMISAAPETFEQAKSGMINQMVSPGPAGPDGMPIMFATPAEKSQAGNAAEAYRDQQLAEAQAAHEKIGNPLVGAVGSNAVQFGLPLASGPAAPLTATMLGNANSFDAIDRTLARQQPRMDPETRRSIAAGASSVSGAATGLLFSIPVARRFGARLVQQAITGAVQNYIEQAAQHVAAGTPMDSQQVRNSALSAMLIDLGFQGAHAAIEKPSPAEPPVDAQSRQPRTQPPRQQPTPQPQSQAEPPLGFADIHATDSQINADEGMLDRMEPQFQRAAQEGQPRRQGPREPGPRDVLDEFNRSAPAFQSQIERRREDADLFEEDKQANRAAGEQADRQAADEAARQQAETIRRGMIDAAPKFGLDPEKVAAMKNPVIVRILGNGGERGELSRDLNEPLTPGKNTATDSVSRANKLSGGTIESVSNMVSDDRSLRDVLAHPADSTKIIKSLMDDGVWNESDHNRFVDPVSGAISDEGKLNIEKTLVGRVVDDPAALARTPSAARTKILSAMPTILEMEGKPGDLMPLLKRTMPALNEWKNSGDSIVDHFFRQSRMGQPPPGYGQPDAAIMSHALSELGPRQFRVAAKTYREMVEPGATMFGGGDYTPDQALRETFGKGLKGVPEESPPVLEARGKQRQSEKSAAMTAADQENHRQALRRAIREAPKSGKNSLHILDSRQSIPSDDITSLAARPYAGPLSDSLHSAFEEVKRILSPFHSDYRLTDLTGLLTTGSRLGTSIQRSWLGGSEAGRASFINPWASVRETEAMVASGEIPRQEAASRTAKDMLDTLIHEAVHQEVPAENAEFKKVLDQRRQQVLESATGQQLVRRLTSLLEKHYEAIVRDDNQIVAPANRRGTDLLGSFTRGGGDAFARGTGNSGDIGGREERGGGLEADILDSSRSDREGRRYAASVDARDQARLNSPQLGILGQLDQWAKKRLAEKDAAQAEIERNIPPGRERQRGSAGSLDPERLALLGIRGAVRVADGAVNLADWVKAMGVHVADFTEAQARKVYLLSRRLARMDEPTRAAWVRENLPDAEPPNPTVKQSIRLNTGQIDTRRAVSEMIALKAGLKKAAAASKQGYKAGQDALQGIKQEFNRIVGENIPTDQRFKLMGDMARMKTVGDVAVGIHHASRILADANLRQAQGDLIDLVGRKQLQIFRPLKTPQAAGGKAARVPGEIGPDDVRTVALDKLSPETRANIQPLLDQAKLLRSQIDKALPGASIEQKIDATSRFQDIEHQIRVLAANDVATKEIAVAGKVKRINDIAAATVLKIDAPEPREVTGEAPGEKSHVMSAWRTQENPDAMLARIVGTEHDAHRVAIQNVRNAQVNAMGESQRYEPVLEDSLRKAGLDPHSFKYHQWLTRREAVKLPDGRIVKMTRPEMLDVYGHSKDADTARLIDSNAQRFVFERNRRAEPIMLGRDAVDAVAAKLTPDEKAIVDRHKKYVEDNLTGPAMLAKLTLDQRAPEPVKGYWPRARGLSEDPPLPTDWRGAQKRWMENIPSQEERAANSSRPLLIRDAINVMHEFVQDAAGLIHVAQPLHEAAAVLQHPDVARALENRYGPQANRQIGQFLLDTAGNRPEARNRAEKIVAGLMRNVSRAWLTLNPSPWIKNIGPGTLSLAPEFSESDLKAGIAGAAKPGAFKRMIEQSPLAWYRYFGRGLYGQYSPLLERHVTPSARLSFIQALKHGRIYSAIDAIPFMQRADAVPFMVAHNAAEAFVDRTQPGLTGESRQQAILDKFHEAVMRTQNGTSSTEISYLASRARRSPLLQPFLMFQSDMNKKLNQFSRWGEMNAAQRSRLVYSTLIGAVTAAGVNYGIAKAAQATGRAITGASVNPDDEERLRSNFGWNLLNNVAGLSYAGNLASDMARSAANGELRLDNPVTTSLGDLFNYLGQLHHATSRYEDAMTGSPQEKAAAEKLPPILLKASVAGSAVSGMPFAPLLQYALTALRSGSYVPPGPRRVARRQRAQQAKAMRESLPGDVQALLAERARLDSIGVRDLTPEERRRRAMLTPIAKRYGHMLHGREPR